jgi:hypothetical protein
MLIPRVAEFREGPKTVQFFWCWSCMELFAFFGNPGRLAAGFAQEPQGQWRVVETVGAENEVRVAIAAVSKVPHQT